MGNRNGGERKGEFAKEGKGVPSLCAVPIALPLLCDFCLA